MKPVCVKCHRFFRCIKSGFYFTEGKPIANDVRPGIDEADKWEPYKIWSGDKFECEGCGAVIVSGFGMSPIAIQHQEKFATMRFALGADKFQVNDC